MLNISASTQPLAPTLRLVCQKESLRKDRQKAEKQEPGDPPQHGVRMCSGPVRHCTIYWILYGSMILADQWKTGEVKLTEHRNTAEAQHYHRQYGVRQRGPEGDDQGNERPEREGLGQRTLLI